jgi:hypothetical protein
MKIKIYLSLFTLVFISSFALVTKAFNNSTNTQLVEFVPIISENYRSTNSQTKIVPTAINARTDLIDDIDFSASDCISVPIVCDGGVAQEEVSWLLFKSEGTEINGELIASGGAPYVDSVCLNRDFCYVLRLRDSNGDGWNGNVLMLGDSSFFVAAPVVGEHNAGGRYSTVYYGECISGCIDEAACNYIANADEEDDSCVYPEMGYDCLGICIGDDTDGDGVCDVDEISGCTDESACNYNFFATDADNSCVYLNIVLRMANNFTIYSSVSSPAYTYSWRLDGEQIPHQNQSSLVAHENGSYSLAIKDLRTQCIATASLDVFGVGISETKDVSLEVYPNPVQNDFVVSAKGLEGNLSLYDVSGKLVLQSVFRDEIQVNMDDFSSGVYLLRLHTSEKVYQAKLLKQ